MEEVPPGIDLCAIQLAHGLQVDHGFRVFAAYHFWVSLHVVERLPCAEGRAHGAPDQEQGLFSVDPPARFLSPLFFVEVPRNTALIHCGEVKGHARDNSIFWQEFGARCDSRGAVYLREHGWP